MDIIEANVDFKLIGQRIKAGRARKGWSQEKLSEVLDVATAYLSRIERGGTSINLKRLAQIAVALDMPFEKLILGIVIEDERYLDKEFKDLLEKCSQEKKRLIYNIAKIVSGIKFV